MTALDQGNGAMADTNGGVVWRWVRIIVLSLAIMFLLGMASGYVAAHLKHGGSILKVIGFVGLVIAGIAACGWFIFRDAKALTPPLSEGEGERLYAAQRKRFWTILGGLLLLGFATGLIGSVVMNVADNGSRDWPAWAPLAGTIGVVLVAIGVTYGSWRFFTSVDEVEVADNLWGSLVGFYFYAILFPTWWALNKLGQVPEPNDWTILTASMFAALGVYFYRKLLTA